MDSKEIKLKRRIVQARKAIQQKYNSLKAKRFNKELDFVQTYKPLIEPLANIQKNFEQKYVVKSEKREAEEEESTTKRRPIIRSTPRTVTPTRMIRIPGITPLSLLPQFSRSPPRFLDTTVRPEEKQHPSTSSPSALLNLSEEFLEQYAPLPRVYVERMIRDTENAIDTTYGIHYNIDTDKWTMGNTPIDVQGEDLLVKGVRYKGTEGLYELIIMNAPDRSLITEQDEENYKQILIDTNVARRSYDAGEQLRGSKRMKYTQIIKPLLTTTTGSGVFKELGNRPIEYKYWNSVHELIRELEVLWSEKRAGNTGLVNDIISIVEELYEDGYIDKPTQSFFSKL
ncbi:hypothetical protein RI129_005850 [Pyrocoelia pectoralis]|uniref:DUF8207 domain-containing protein n=1 Tax=Pyrocoelia pectoralis TaxID=417401 RepID=A0AAN7VA57_9COLE